MPSTGISILSAVWNEAAHIQEMIDSVLQQENVAFELLFVDDGSTDNTVKIIKRAARRDERIRLVAEHEHSGKVRAFNAAYAASKYDYVCLLAGDDLFVPHALEERLAVISRAPKGAKAVMWGKLISFSADPARDGMLLPRGDGVSRSGASCVLTRALADLIFPIPEMLPNEDTWLRICAEELASYSYEVPRVFVKYRIHSGNTALRDLDFDEYHRRSLRRGEVWRLLLSEPRLGFGQSARKRIEANWRLEQALRKKSLLAVASVRDISLIERLAASWKANYLLYQIRTRNFRLFTGWLKA